MVSILIIFINYVVKLCEILDGCDLLWLTLCKKIVQLNFTCLSKNFHNRHQTTGVVELAKNWVCNYLLEAKILGVQNLSFLNFGIGCTNAHPCALCSTATEQV